MTNLRLMRTLARTTALALCLGLALAGCGGGDDDEATPPAEGEGMVAEEGGSAPPDLEEVDDPTAEVERRLEEVGLEICDEDTTSGDISGSYEGHYWSVDTPCPEDPLDRRGYLNLDEYNSADTAYTEMVMPSGDAYVTWLLDPTTKLSTGETTHPDVLALLDEAFGDLETGGPRRAEGGG